MRPCYRIRSDPLANDNGSPFLRSIGKLMRGNIGNLMKQAQVMQERMQKAQAEVQNIEVVGEAGGGMVKVTLSGRHQVKRVQIEHSSSSVSMRQRRQRCTESSAVPSAETSAWAPGRPSCSR